MLITGDEDEIPSSTTAGFCACKPACFQYEGEGESLKWFSSTITDVELMWFAYKCTDQTKNTSEDFEKGVYYNHRSRVFYEQHGDAAIRKLYQSQAVPLAHEIKRLFNLGFNIRASALLTSSSIQCSREVQEIPLATGFFSMTREAVYIGQMPEKHKFVFPQILNGWSRGQNEVEYRGLKVPMPHIYRSWANRRVLNMLARSFTPLIPYTLAGDRVFEVYVEYPGIPNPLFIATPKTLTVAWNEAEEEDQNKPRIFEVERTCRCVVESEHEAYCPIHAVLVRFNGILIQCGGQFIYPQVVAWYVLPWHDTKNVGLKGKLEHPEINVLNFSRPSPSWGLPLSFSVRGTVSYTFHWPAMVVKIGVMDWFTLYGIWTMVIQLLRLLPQRELAEFVIARFMLVEMNLPYVEHTSEKRKIQCIDYKSSKKPRTD